MLAFANRVIFVPGYGLATAQAQHAVRELAELLVSRGVDRPVRHSPRRRPHARPHERAAGRGQRALRPFFEMDEINPEFQNTDVAVVIGANDVVNPDARDNKHSPLYGMPILDVDRRATSSSSSAAREPGSPAWRTRCSTSRRP